MVGGVGLLLLAHVLLTVSYAAEYRPVVLMHGVTSDRSSMDTLAGWLYDKYPGIYVKNVDIGDGYWDSILMSMNDQCANFAEQLLADPKLARGFSMVGHSQGGLVTRCALERYPLKVYNYVSLAGPNAGQYGVPEINAMCPDSECPWLVEMFDLLVTGGWTDPLVQDHLSFASYWKDPLDYSAYLQYSTFLPDLNNERPAKNATYKERVLALNTMMLIHSTIDNTIIPRTSPWFWFYANGSISDVVPVQKTAQWTEDWLGLRALYERGALQFESVNCSHSHIPEESCKWAFDTLYGDLLGTFLPAGELL